MSYDKYYDMVIIGAGPSGLALAQRCAQINKKVIIIDHESTIGGCHRVRRVLTNNELLFTEHGPRVYSNNYVVFQQLLREMGADFYDIFVKYKFNITEIGNETLFSVLTYHEIFQLFLQFLLLMINSSHGKKTSLYDFIRDFKPESIDIIDRICRLTDGGDSRKFTLNEFLQLFNQQFFYDIYQPKLPNDKGLFKLWEEYLKKLNTDILLDAEIFDIKIENNTISKLIIKKYNVKDYIIINGTKFVFAIPPMNLKDIISNHNLPHSWGNIVKYAYNTAYIDYMCVSFHWDSKLPLKRIYGFPKSEWGIAFVVLTDYMTFDEKQSQTVISTAITISDRVSPRLNKTALQASKKEIIDEIIAVLNNTYDTTLPKPNAALFSPGVVFSEGGYTSKDTAFISSSLEEFLPFQNKLITNMYTLGSQNGYSEHKFTTLESAVSNAVALSKEIYPELQYKKYPISNITSLIDFLKILIIIVIIIIYYYGKK